MTPRSIRRAAERQALKRERQEQRSLPAASFAPLELSSAEPGASREPAPLLETRQPAGTLTQAVPTLLAGRTLLLPAADATAYAHQLGEFAAAFSPADILERQLVQSLADTSWRLERLLALETALYTRGRLELQAAASSSADPAAAPAMLDLQTHLTYEKPLRNLQLQENRLQRRYYQELREFRQLRQERDRAREAAKALPPSAPTRSASAPAPRRAAAPDIPTPASAAPEPVAPGGFEFSNHSLAAPLPTLALNVQIAPLPFCRPAPGRVRYTSAKRF